MYIKLYTLFKYHAVLITLIVNTAYGTKSIFCYFLCNGRPVFDTVLCSCLCKTHSFKSVASSDKETGSQALHTAVLALGTLLNLVVLLGKCVLPSLSSVN